MMESLGFKYVTLVGGFLGAMVSLKFIEGLSVYQRGSTVLAGTVVSAYITPIAVTFLEITPKLEGGIAFILGLFGMSLTGAIIKAMPEWVAAAKERLFK